ncbi:MAG TPA: TAXI family TRAP transporter solute-binding subunit [Candidatus Sulfotelmatobacter sp.]|nr:TAXI family TRAP transporter solute-binding subunit [Candidatus Sulfotelmatobacter sp.]
MARRIICLLFLVVVWLLVPRVGRATEPAECHAKSANKPILLTGTPGLGYDLVGRTIVDSYNREAPDDQQIVACNSAGSLENVERLLENGGSPKGKDKDVTFALVQSDLAHAVWMNHPLFKAKDADACFPLSRGLAEDSDRLQLITPLYVEAVHILIRPHLNISTLSDLRRHRVWMGGDRSGIFYAAERVLSGAGVRPCDVTDPGKDKKGSSVDAFQAFDSLQGMNLDAVFYTGALPTHIIQDALERTPEIRLLPLDYALVKRLTSDGSYMEMLIRNDDYGQNLSDGQGILTVGVQALLVTNNNPKYSGVVKRLVEYLAIPANQKSIRRGLAEAQEAQRDLYHKAELSGLCKHPADFRRELVHWASLPSKQAGLKKEILRKVEDAIDERQEPVKLSPDEEELVLDYWKMHEDATPKIRFMEVTPQEAFREHFQPDAQQAFHKHWWRSWILEPLPPVAAIFAALALFVWKRKTLGPWLLRNPTVTFGLIGIVLALAIGLILMMRFEGHANEDFSRLPTALLHIFPYFVPIVGKTALTPRGQLTLKILSGVATFLFVGAIFPWVKSFLKIWIWQPLCGWLEGDPWRVKEKDKPIVIINWDDRVMERIASEREVDGSPGRPAVILAQCVPRPAAGNGSNNVRVVEGSGTAEDSLEKACVQKAHSVTILSSWQPTSAEDRRKHLDADLADTKTILTILKIRQLSRMQPNGRAVPITAEILRASNRDEAQRAGRGGDIQIVSL